MFVRCVGEDERGSGGGRVARLVFSPGPRVVETLTLPVSRALFLSLCPKALVDGRGRLAFSLGCRFGGAREEGGPVSTDGGDFGGRVIVFSDASNTRGGCWGERERGVRLASRVCGACGGLWSSAGHPRCETHVLSLSLFRPPLFDRSLRVGGYWRRPTVCGGAISLSAPSLFLCRAACTCWA